MAGCAWEQGQDYIKILNKIVSSLIWKVTFESKPKEMKDLVVETRRGWGWECVLEAFAKS